MKDLQEIIDNSPELKQWLREKGQDPRDYFCGPVYDEEDVILLFCRMSKQMLELQEQNERLKAHLVEIKNQSKLITRKHSDKLVKNGIALVGEPLSYETPLYLVNKI